MSPARLMPIAACLLTMIGLAADDHAALPADVQKITDKADAAVAVLVKSGDAQIAKIKQQEIKDLLRIHDAVAKKDAEGAKSIQARIDEIKEGLKDAPAPAPAPAPAATPTPTTSPAPSLAPASPSRASGGSAGSGPSR